MSKARSNQPYVKWNDHQDPFVATRIKIIVLLFVGLIGSVALSFFVLSQYSQRLQDRAASFAQAISSQDVAQLKYTAVADDYVPYQEVKDKLAQLKQINYDSRRVYIINPGDKAPVFLAGSETPGSSLYTQRGSVYPAATPALYKAFHESHPAGEGPVKNEYGFSYVSFAPVLDKQGVPVAVLGIDVSAGHYLLASIGIGASVLLTAVIWSLIIYFYDKQRNRRLEAFRLQIELMSIASHELRTPLSGIRWGQEVLLQGKLDETQGMMVKAMYDSTLQLQDSIEDILQLTAINAAKPKQIARLPVDIAELIDATRKVQQLSAQQRGITFNYDQSWAPPFMTEGDATQLRRVFNNLLSNAIKYASNDSVITLSYKKEENEHVIIIRNQGIGVPKKELAHIFDGFYRATNAIEKQVTGTGMGLYLSRQTVQQHGGRLWLESVENESTTVFVALPSRTAPLAATDGDSVKTNE